MPGAGRLRRKEIKQPDLILTFTGRAFRWASEHRRMVAIVAGLVVASVLAAGATLSYRGAQREQANADMAPAFELLEKNDTTGAAARLAEAARSWRNTGAGRVAAVMAPGLEVRKGNHDSAIAMIQSLGVATDTSSPEYLRQQALVIWAAALEGKGDWAAAAARYGEAAALSGPHRAQALLGQARATEQAGNVEAARTLYKKYYDDFPDAPDREIARRKAGA